MSAGAGSARARMAQRGIVAIALLVVGLLAVPSAADGNRGLSTGFFEAGYGSLDPAVREQAFERTVQARAEVVRWGVPWSLVARSQPAAPRDPADPAYDWGTLDEFVREARERGLTVLLTATGAPAWAEGANRPGGVNPGVWKPDPAAYGDFAHAVAERYSGGYLGLPRVTHFQAWNEPNLSTHLAPQYRPGSEKQFAAGHYRRMLNAFYGGVKSVHADNLVVSGGTAPYGDPPGGARTRPLAFLRKLLCLNNRRELRATRCPTKAKFDIIAHHPINTSGGPTRSAFHPDDASTPDFKNVRRTLRAAERRHTVATKGRHALWATELWWDSNPPDRVEGVAVRKHARWIEQALYLLWKQGAKVVINLQLQDSEFDPNDPFEDNSTGVFYVNGTPKPAFTAFRFPFVTDRARGDRLTAWGKAPVAGDLVIERKGDRGWRRVDRLEVVEGQVFTTRLRVDGPAKLRASLGAETSLVWRQKD